MQQQPLTSFRYGALHESGPDGTMKDCHETVMTCIGYAFATLQEAAQAWQETHDMLPSANRKDCATTINQC